MNIEELYAELLEDIEVAGEAAYALTEKIVEITNGRKSDQISTREKVAIMVLCRIISRLCKDVPLPTASLAAYEAALTYATVGATTGLVPVGSSVALFDQIS